MKVWWAMATVAVAVCGQAMATFARSLRLSTAVGAGHRLRVRRTPPRRPTWEPARHIGTDATVSPVDERSIDELLQRAQGEYLEMPGLRGGQAQRLWGLRSSTCDVILTALLEKRFLRRTRDGAFVLESPR